jgi:hypothetical protein
LKVFFFPLLKVKFSSVAEEGWWFGFCRSYWKSNSILLEVFLIIIKLIVKIILLLMFLVVAFVNNNTESESKNYVKVQTDERSEAENKRIFVSFCSLSVIFQRFYSG